MVWTGKTLHLTLEKGVATIQ